MSGSSDMAMVGIYESMGEVNLGEESRFWVLFGFAARNRCCGCVSGKGEFAVCIDSEPVEAAEGAEDGGGGLAFFFAFAVFDGGGAAEAAVALDADDGGVGLEVDPVSPCFGFMAWDEVFFFQGGEDLADGAGSGVFWELDECFHGKNVW